jgi:hypothetical protein
MRDEKCFREWARWFAGMTAGDWKSIEAKWSAIVAWHGGYGFISISPTEKNYNSVKFDEWRWF